MLVSILCASYKRFDGLVKMIESCKKTAKQDNYEIIVRFSEADDEAASRVAELDVYDNVRVIWGPQRRGYIDIDLALTEALKVAVGNWIHIIDDDMTITGDGWDEKLAAYGDRQVFITHEFYNLGPSCYGLGGSNGTGWILPRSAWDVIGELKIPNPPDTMMLRYFVWDRAWEHEWLKGSHLVHNWMRPTDGDR